MAEKTTPSISRRQFLKTAGATALSVGAGPAVIIPGRAQPRTLRILTARSFARGHAQWFKDHAQAWGEENDTRVEVDIDKRRNIASYLEAEIATQDGHDIIGSSGNADVIYDQVIDHRELYEECEHRYGRFPDFVLKQVSTGPARKVVEISYLYSPALTHYRRDLWEAVGTLPNTWENVLQGGRRIKFNQNKPVWLSLGPNWDGELTLRTILYSFGGTVQNIDHQPALKSEASLDAIHFVKSLYEQAMSEGVVSPDISNLLNNQVMLKGDASLTLNALSITRPAERLSLPVNDQIMLARVPEGPVRRLSPPYFNKYRILKFSKNIDLAGRFILDLVGQSREEVLTSGFFLLPLLPVTVPDLAQLLANDANAAPPGKYRVLAETLEDSTTELGFPGYMNLASVEVQRSGVIPKMFTNAATGKMTPEEVLTQADREVRKIYDKWRALGKI